MRRPSSFVFALCVLVVLANASTALAASQTFSSSGSYSFKVPPYSTLTVAVSGGGGGGGAGNVAVSYTNTDGYMNDEGDYVFLGGTDGYVYCGSGMNGGDGGASSFNGVIFGYGGSGGLGGCGQPTDPVFWYTSSPGGASGGDTNVAGGGGAGGSDSHNPAIGASPSNGGNGGLATKTYQPKDLQSGSTVPVVVGGGGAAGVNPLADWWFRSLDGSPGAPGSVTITWTPACPDGTAAPNGDLLQCNPPPRCSDGSIPPQGDVTQCADQPTQAQCPAGYTYQSDECIPGGLCQWSLASFNLGSFLGADCSPVPPTCPAGYSLGADGSCHLTVTSCPAGETLDNGVCTGTIVSTSTCPVKSFCGVDQNQYEQEFINNTCSAVVTAQCPYGCSAGSCNPPPQMTVSFSATPLLVRPGESTTLSWSATNAASCTVTGTNGDSFSGTNGTQSSAPLTSQTIFTFSCTALPTILPASLTQSVTVSLVPVFNEQ